MSRAPRLVGVWLGIAVGLLGAELSVRALLANGRLVEDVVDIQSPATLCLKLERVRRFEGYRVVLLGDSVVYGRALELAGDDAWRQHELGAVLRDGLRERLGDVPLLVMNLGMNGALPADQLRVVELLGERPVDVIVSSVNLRSFSGDFAEPGARFSRPWLPELGASAEGGCAIAAPGAGLDAEVDAALSRVSVLYGSRDLLQWRLLGSTPRMVVEQLGEAIDRHSEPADPDEQLTRELFTMLNAKRRYQSVDLAADNPQRAAQRTLTRLLGARARRGLIFYTLEDPSRRDDLLDAAAYSALRAELDALIRASLPANVTYLDSFQGLPAERYLDYVHPDAAGYERLGHAVLEALQPLPPPSP